MNPKFLKAPHGKAALSMAGSPVLGQHDCCDAFPEMQHDEYQSLKTSIDRNGQLESVLVWRNKLVDGRQRMRACKELGKTPAMKHLDKDMSEEAMVALVYSINLNRRHLTVGQRAMLAAQLTLPATAGKSKKAGKPAAQLTQEKAANLFAVSRDSVQQACVVYKQADAKLIEDVKSAGTGLNEAVEILRGKKGIRAQLCPSDRTILRKAAALKSELATQSRNKRLTMQASVSKGNLALPKAKYSVVLADPPWDYGMKNDRSASRVIPHDQYPTMSIEELCAMPVELSLAKDAMLFLWCPASLLPDGLKLMESWGFDYLTNWIWHKTSGKLTCAGGTAIARHELVLVGKRRNGLITSGNAARESSVFESAVTQHSAKPFTVHERIEKLYPDVKNRIELFCRIQRKGWEVWGNQSCAAAPSTKRTHKDSANDGQMAIAA